jgi:putative ABC transport system permease protein
MITHICKLFIRNFRKSIVINMLNLIGLAAGLAACMMIIVYLHHEFSYDDFHEHGDRIVRVTTYQNVGEGQEITVPTASYPVAEGLAAEIGAVETFVRFQFPRSMMPVYVDDRIFYEEHLVWADSTLFDVFSYRLLQGDPKTALAAKASVVLAESTAKKYFGDGDPIGREILVGGTRSYTVTGVMEDIPQPSHVYSHPMIMSMSSLDIDGKDYWVGRSGYASYILLREGHTAAEVQPVADKVYFAHAQPLLEQLSADCRITLQPLSEIHFDDSFDFIFDYQPPVTYRKIAVFALIAAFILIIACVNFVNMTTARSTERAHQVGISKAVGASRRILVVQFLGESLITALIALAVAFLLVELLLPVFSGFVGRELSLVYTDRPILLATFFALSVVVGIGAGLYPAFVLSSMRPSETIRERFLSGSSRSLLRRVLIGFQFTVAILLIISTLTVHNQLRYMDGRYPGFDRNQLLMLTVSPTMSRENCELIRTEALRHPGFLAGTCSSYLPTMSHMEYTFRVPEEANCEMLMTRMFAVDPWFIETMGMELIDGRDFYREGSADVGNSVIINETAARQLGWDEPVGRQLDANPGKETFSPMTIIGVVKDVNFESYHHEIQPMTLVIDQRTPSRVVLRLKDGSVEAAIEYVRGIWEENFPQAPFRYRFLDETFEYMYREEIRLSSLLTFYSTLAVVISCVGLLALIAFSTERRVREIGIRKVLGATPRNLYVLLSSEYLRIVIVAFVIAGAAAWLALQRWLENFAYRAPFPWWLFPAAGVLVLVLALATAGAYTWRACQVNPVEILRQE